MLLLLLQEGVGGLMVLQVVHLLDLLLLLVVDLETGVEETEIWEVLEAVEEHKLDREAAEQETPVLILLQKEIPEEMEQTLEIQEMQEVGVVVLPMPVRPHLVEQVVEEDMQRQFHPLSKTQVLQLDLPDIHHNQ